MYDYINRVVITLPLLVYEGTWRTLSPIVVMHHLDGSCVCVGFFLKLPRSPIVASEPGLCVDVIYTSRTQRVVGDNSHTAYQHVILWFGSIVGWSGSDRHYTYAYARLVLPTCFAHRWLVSVCFSNFNWIVCCYAGPCWRLKQHTWQKIVVVWCVGKNGSC